NGVGYSVGDRPIFGSPVVERAMRLHMDHPGSLLLRDGLEALDLPDDRCTDFVRRQGHFPSTEVLPIFEARMRAYGPTRGDGQRDGSAHGRVVAGMAATGDVGRGDPAHQFGVVGRAFAEVAV